MRRVLVGGLLLAVALPAAASANCPPNQKCAQAPAPHQATPAPVARPAPMPTTRPAVQSAGSAIVRPAYQGNPGVTGQRAPRTSRSATAYNSPDQHAPSPAQTAQPATQNGHSFGAFGSSSPRSTQAQSTGGTAGGGRAAAGNASAAQGSSATHGFHGGAPVRSASGHVYIYQGQRYPRFEAPRYVWPHGYHYRRYTVGWLLPQAFWGREYYIDNYADYGLEPPPYGFEWIRYGPDLLLVDLGSGRITNVVPGAFEEGAPAPEMMSEADSPQ